METCKAEWCNRQNYWEVWVIIPYTFPTSIFLAFNRRPPSLSMLTSYWISSGLTHLGSKASNFNRIFKDYNFQSSNNSITSKAKEFMFVKIFFQKKKIIIKIRINPNPHECWEMSIIFSIVERYLQFLRSV